MPAKLGGVYTLVSVLFAVALLSLSLLKASLDVTLRGVSEKKWNNWPVRTIIATGDGEINWWYNVPDVQLLPTSRLYPLKNIRDHLWLLMTRSNYDKGSLMLLLADKKISETRKMIDQNQPLAALDSLESAISLLQKADSILEDFPAGQDESRQVHYIIYLAGKANQGTADLLGQKISSDLPKYWQIRHKIQLFNEQQEREKAEKNY